jgi:hypothetical protein
VKKKQVINNYKVPSMDHADVISTALAIYAEARTSFPAYNKNVIWPSAYARARQHRNTLTAE